MQETNKIMTSVSVGIRRTWISTKGYGEKKRKYAKIIPFLVSLLGTGLMGVNGGVGEKGRIRANRRHKAK